MNLRTSETIDESTMNDIVDPITGEVIDPHDVDGLAEMHQRCSERVGELMEAKRVAAAQLAALTIGDTKTRRLRGEKHRVKVTMPSDTWDRTRLKEIWFSCNTFARRYLKIAEISPIAKEVKKLQSEASDVEGFSQFRERVLSCNLGPMGTPHIKIEDE